MSYLRQLVGGAGERRDFSTSWTDSLRRSGSAGWAGVPVTERTALQQLTVYSCVSLISDTLAQLPVGAFRGKGPTRTPLADPQILTEPFAEMTFDEWIGAGSMSTLLRGNFYGEVISRDGLGFPTQIMPMHPDEAHPFRDKASGRARYRVAGGRVLERSDVFHLKGLTLPGVVMSIKGLSPIEYAAQTIGTTLAAEEYGARYFSEASVHPGYLVTDGDVDEDEAKDMQQRWVATHGNRDRKPAVLGGGLKYQRISIAPNEAQFLETIQAKREEIAGFYRVPPHMIGMVEKSTSWGTGVEEQMLGYVTFTCGIWITRWERALSRLLPRPQYVKFNLGGLLRGRLTQRYQAYLQGRQGGWLSIDDIRALEDMPPLDEDKGTDYLQPLNFAPIPAGGGPPDVTAAPDS